MPDRRDLPHQVFGCDQVGLRQDDKGLNMAFACHHQVPVEPPYVEIEMAGLDDEGDIDVCRDHLEVHGLAGSLATQERPSRKDRMNDRRAARRIVLHAHPISNAR